MASDRAQILITAIDQTKAALASVKANLEGLSSAASKVNGVLAGLGAALSLGALVAAGKAALDTADNLSKLSQKTGISVESLSLLKPIAEQSGISLEGLAKGMQKLATAMVEAAGGSKEQVEAFSRLGVSVKDAAGQLRPTEEVLLDLADAFAAMPDGAEKSALAVKLFGKSGVELIPFLNQGRAGIEQLKQKFKELGLEISGDTAKAAEKFNDTLDTVKQALSGIAMKVAEAALPALQKLADALVALASHGEEIMAVLRVLGEIIVAVLAVKGVAAVAALGGALAVLKAAFMRFLPVLAAVAVWEMGRGIVNMVQDIRETNRAIDEMNRQRQQLEQLTALPGVGRKTANVIRGNIYHEPSVVVDTHVKRISKKLGLTKEDDPEKVEYELMKVLPKDHWILYNIQIITLGRTICKAPTPKCGECFLTEWCKDYQNRQKKESRKKK